MFAEWVAGQWEEQIDQVRDSQQRLGRRREGDAGTGEGQGAPPGSEHRRLLTSIWPLIIWPLILTGSCPDGINQGQSA